MNSIAYAFWAIGKIQEILAFGELGSTVISTVSNFFKFKHSNKRNGMELKLNEN